MKKAPGLVVASVVLFCTGLVHAAIYVASLVESGDRPIGFLESSCALIGGAWVCAALHLFRTRGTAPLQKTKRNTPESDPS